MECRNCHYPLEPGAQFCSRCGSKVENPNEFCAYCGSHMNIEDRFCNHCGRPRQRVGTRNYDKVSYHTNSEQMRGTRPSQIKIKEEERSSSKKSVLGLYLLIILIPIIMSLILLIILKPWKIISEKSKQLDIKASEEKAQLIPDEYNLEENDELSFGGRIFLNTQNKYVFKWNGINSILGKDENGQLIRASNISSAYIDVKDMDPEFLVRLGEEDSLSITGKFFFMNKQIYVKPTTIKNTSGQAMMDIFTKEKEEMKAKEAETKKEEPKVSEKSNFILAVSQERLLTENDLKGLSAKELNYAKNEIYARHGRKFKSNELRTYFESQSWYKPRVEPEAFTNSMLSEIERKNTEILKEAEYKLAPNGYPLDQN